MTQLTWYNNPTTMPSITISTTVITFNHAMQTIIGNATHADIGLRHDDNQPHLGFRFHNNGRYKINKERNTWTTTRPRKLTIPPARQLQVQHEGDITYTIINPSAHDQQTD
jgi:hypothetical protein